jgi:uncharacterized coiled-coil DUF342 family protein
MNDDLICECGRHKPCRHCPDMNNTDTNMTQSLRDAADHLVNRVRELTTERDEARAALRLGFDAVAELIDLHHLTPRKDRNVEWDNKVIKLDLAYREISDALEKSEP